MFLTQFIEQVIEQVFQQNIHIIFDCLQASFNIKGHIQVLLSLWGLHGVHVTFKSGTFERSGTSFHKVTVR